MRRFVLAVVVTAIGLVLLLSFKPHQVTSAAPRPAASSGAAATTDAGSTASPDTGQASSAKRPSADASAGTFTGETADTRWGPVQVEIRVAAGKITEVKVLQSPDGNRRDLEINQEALPILHDEAIQAQNAQIDAVSGATYTSDGYTRSLQSAIDRAGL